MRLAASRARAATLALCAIVTLAGCRESSSPADRLYGEALTRASVLDFGGATEFLRRALQADPAFLPAVIELFSVEPGGPTLGLPSTVEATASLVPDSALATCYRRLAAIARGLRSPPEATGPRSEVAEYCELFRRGWVFSGTDNASIRDLRQLVARYPSATQLPRLLTDAVARAGHWDEVMRLATAMMRPDQPPLVRATGYSAAARAEHERGRDQSAARIERALRDDPAWALPGFRLLSDIGEHMVLNRLGRSPGDTALVRHVHSITVTAEEVRLEAALEGDPLGRMAASLGVALSRLDRGRIDEAVSMLEGLAPLADSVGDVGFQGYVHMRLGRAYVKRGRSSDAERELLHARGLAALAAMPAVQKEVEHNLLHLYESLRRDGDALAAGKAFVRYADMGGLHPVRMMSRRDLGLFLRARGALTESRYELERMMADIDSLGAFWFFAGEYRELSGDLASARHYYDRALLAGDEPVRALEGLVRVHLTLGDTAAALRMARAHDSRRDASGRPESAPLLPTVLAVVAPADSARSAFHAARRVVERHGQVAAWAALTADLAALELRLGSAARAAALADSARRAATDVGANNTALRAGGLQALAQWSLNREPVAMRNLHAAVREGEAGAGPQLRAELNRMLARALAVDGRWRESMSWYARAAAPLDSMAAVIPLDAQQAEFRAAQRGVYDEALATIISHAGDPQAIAVYTEWSTRRKGRTYGIDLGPRVAARPPTPREGVAIVDYVLLDSAVAALVVAPAGTGIVSLGPNAAAVRSAVQRMRRALDVRVGGALDLARAAFPLDVAHELYQLLVRPIERFLAGAHTLVVVPDGVLHLVPFDALVSVLPPDGRDERQARFLMDSVAVVQSVSSDVNEAAWRVAMRRVVAIAPASPGRVVPDSKAEIVAVEKAFGQARFSVLRGAQATARAVLEVAASDAILHFIAHAKASDSDPGSSWIALSPDEDHSGPLEAWEVARARVRSPLVVLSACETAGGRALEGEGVLSLSRSFLRAGALATLATLWPIGPLASEFPAAFYEALQSGAAAPAAMRAAKRELRARGVPAFAWAPYQFVSASRRR